MDQFHSYKAILFSSDGNGYLEMVIRCVLISCLEGRPPNLVQLMTSPTSQNSGYRTPEVQMPHPEIHMDYVAEGTGARCWKYQLVESLDCMNRKFANPYIIFYPVVSRDGMPFPVNRSIRILQGSSFKEERAWRGNIVVAKYNGGETPFSSLIDASMADFAMLKNYFLTHSAPPIPQQA